MATIKSQMTLNDGMSGVLKKITQALDLTLASFERVQQASGSALNVAEIEAARGALVEANAEIEAMEDCYRKAAREEEKLNQGINQGASAMDGLLGKVASVAAAYASLGKMKSFAVDSMSAADVQIGAQVQLKTVMGNMGSLDYYDQVLDRASAIQGRGMYGDEAMIAGAGELATYFSDGEAVMSMMDTLTNYAAGMSLGEAVNPTEMVNYATNLGKIMTGTYTAMGQKGFEFTDAQKAIIEGAASEAQIVAELGTEYLNMSSDMQAAAVIGNVINESWAGLYETMSNTPSGLITQLNNALGDVQETVGAGIYPAVLDFVNMAQSNLPQIESAAMGLAAVLGFTVTVLTGMAEGAISFGSAVADNWEWISPIVMGIVTTLMAYHGVLFALTVVESIHNGLAAVSAATAALQAGKTLAQAAATTTAAGAQVGLNAALLACPVTWVVVGVIALIAVFYAAAGAVNHFAGTSVSATGLICGAVAAAGAFIGNTTIGLLNALITAVWTIFVAPFLGIVEWILNVCDGGFNSFGGAVANLIGQIIGWFLNLGKVVTTIIDAIFGTSWTAGLESLQGAVMAWGKNDSAITLDKNAPTVDYRFEYGSAWDSGYDFGEGLAEKVGGFFGGLGYTPGTMDGLMEKYGSNIPGDSLDGIGDDVGAIADNTGGMASAMEISGEELKYLRDIAERDAINRFTTAEVKIDMTGMTNKIDSSMDLDGVIRGLTDGFSESLATAAEGVHE